MDVPGLINLSRVDLADDTPFELNHIRDLLAEVTETIEGVECPTLWKRVTGAGFLILIHFPTLAARQEYEEKLLNSGLYEQLSAEFSTTPNVERFTIHHHQGHTPGEIPIDGYCTTNAHDPEPGFERDELAEARYVLDSLWQIDGFLGAYVGTSQMAPGRLDSIAFWRDNNAVEQAIPIRVETNLRIYRRVL
jgi:hypothetical protein